MGSTQVWTQELDGMHQKCLGSLPTLYWDLCHLSKAVVSREVLITEKDKHHIHLQEGQEEGLGNYRLVFLMSVHGKVIEQTKKVHGSQIGGSCWSTDRHGRHSQESWQIGEIHWQKLHEVQERQCKVWHLGRYNPKQQNWLGSDCRFAEKGEGAAGPDGQVKEESAVCPYSNEGKLCTGLH